MGFFQLDQIILGFVCPRKRLLVWLLQKIQVHAADMTPHFPIRVEDGNGFRVSLRPRLVFRPDFGGRCNPHLAQLHAEGRDGSANEFGLLSLVGDTSVREEPAPFAFLGRLLEDDAIFPAPFLLGAQAPLAIFVKKGFILLRTWEAQDIVAKLVGYGMQGFLAALGHRQVLLRVAQLQQR